MNRLLALTSVGLLTAVIAVVAFTAGATAADIAIVVQDDVSDQCATIIGCADAGPKPEHSGDRGGWAQLLTLGVLVAAMSFIMTKVIRAAKASQPQPSE